MEATPSMHPGTFSVVLDKRGLTATKLGVTVSVIIIEGQRYLRIMNIKEGLIKDWNDKHSLDALREGDVIMDVNGIRSGSEELYATIAGEDVLKLIIMRKE